MPCLWRHGACSHPASCGSLLLLLSFGSFSLHQTEASPKHRRIRYSGIWTDTYDTGQMTMTRDQVQCINQPRREVDSPVNPLRNDHSWLMPEPNFRAGSGSNFMTHKKRKQFKPFSQNSSKFQHLIRTSSVVFFTFVLCEQGGIFIFKISDKYWIFSTSVDQALLVTQYTCLIFCPAMSSYAAHWAGSNNIKNLKFSTLQVVVKPFNHNSQEEKNIYIFLYKWLANLQEFANICKLSVAQTF